HIVEGIVLAVMRHAAVRRPQLAHDLEAFLEDALIVRERDVERQVFARVVAAAGCEIDPPVAQEIERRKLLGDAAGLVQRAPRHPAVPGGCAWCAPRYTRVPGRGRTARRAS